MIAVIDLRAAHSPKALVDYGFDKATNDLLKRRAGGRWSPQLKSWWVPYSQVTAATQALEGVGYEVQHIGGKLTADLAAESLEAATYAFLSELTPNQSTKAYRALALALHPDTGGSTEVMRSVNDAYHRTKQ
jgi:hypothetical protein